MYGASRKAGVGSRGTTWETMSAYVKESMLGLSLALDWSIDCLHTTKSSRSMNINWDCRLTRRSFSRVHVVCRPASCKLTSRGIVSGIDFRVLSAIASTLGFLPGCVHDPPARVPFVLVESSRSSK